MSSEIFYKPPAMKCTQLVKMSNLLALFLNLLKGHRILEGSELNHCTL